MLKCILDNRLFDVTARDSHHCTQFYYAIDNDHDDTAKLLLENLCINLNLMINNDLGLIHLARKPGENDLLKYLVEETNIDGNSITIRKLHYILSCDMNIMIV